MFFLTHLMIRFTESFETVNGTFYFYRRMFFPIHLFHWNFRNSRRYFFFSSRRMVFPIHSMIRFTEIFKIVDGTFYFYRRMYYFPIQLFYWNFRNSWRFFSFLSSNVFFPIHSMISFTEIFKTVNGTFHFCRRMFFLTHSMICFTEIFETVDSTFHF
jgi:hypothetical protein